MAHQVIDILSWILILSGSFFYLVGAIGLVRMPDVFTRKHAVSVSDTLGVILLVVGMLLQAGLTLNAAKLGIILAVLLFTAPVATHALARAAMYAGVKPSLTEDRTGRPIKSASATDGSKKKPVRKTTTKTITKTSTTKASASKTATKSSTTKRRAASASKSSPRKTTTSKK